MSVPQVIVLGSINVDLVVRSPRLPRAGETVLGGEFMQAGGGKGANQAVAAARLSQQPVAFIAAVGTDDFGRSSIKQLRAENLHTQHIRMLDGHATGVALIVVGENGENQITVASGANAQLTPADIAAIDDSVFASAKVFVACLESPLETVIAGLRRAKAAGLRTVLNPAPACAEIKDAEILKLVDVLTPNETEAELLTGWNVQEDLEDAVIACDQLRQKGVGQVIITRGASGCILRDESREASWLPAYEVQAVDTTAAGDCFTGALATALAEGRDLRSAARWAIAASAISVTRAGAMPSLPTRAEVECFLADRSL